MQNASSVANPHINIRIYAAVCLFYQSVGNKTAAIKTADFVIYVTLFICDFSLPLLRRAIRRLFHFHFTVSQLYVGYSNERSFSLLFSLFPFFPTLPGRWTPLVALESQLLKTMSENKK